MKTNEEQEWIDAYLNGTIEPEAFEALQNRMLESAELRKTMRRNLALHDFLENQASSDESAEPWLEAEPEKKIIRFPNPIPMAIAAALAFLLGLGFMHFSSKQTTEVAEAAEPVAEGFAVISRLSQTQSGYREGDTLGSEIFKLASGAAEIQFFSGATMTVEGPAEISLKSAWEARCVEGSVRMRVPPAARGFKLHAPSTEIIDLGTEFGLVVRDGEGHVEVFDGEIALRHRDEEEKILKTGAALGLNSDGPSVAEDSGQVAFPEAGQFRPRAAEQLLIDFERWQAYRNDLPRDDRLIAFYDLDRTSSELIPNLTEPRNPELDGAVILAEPVDSRWPGLKSALEFNRPGSRIRVSIPGEFSAFTFACWVRIDSLDRKYSALFMGDGYENGEPHWQIRDDGKMMLSVMVDDSRPSVWKEDVSGFHWVYFSPPIWDMTMSGRWMHLASVFDPEKREVSHFVNGERVARKSMKPEFVIDKLRIGNAEIGNWGLPNREDPSYAIRNLNGRMDEIAIFRAALGEEEIAELFERSRARR